MSRKIDCKSTARYRRVLLICSGTGPATGLVRLSRGHRRKGFSLTPKPSAACQYLLFDQTKDIWLKSALEEWGFIEEELHKKIDCELLQLFSGSHIQELKMSGLKVSITREFSHAGRRPVTAGMNG